MNVLFVVIDGLGDRPSEALGGMTPLEAASTPNLDSIVASGAAGLLSPLGPGVSPGTDTAHFVFFGNPLEEYPGRALFEAAGAGLEVADGDVVFKGSFCHVEQRGDLLHLVKRQVDIDDEDAQQLVGEVASYESGNYEVELAFTGGKESILYVRGGSLSSAVTDSDPYADDTPIIAVEAMDSTADATAANTTAEVVTEYLRWAFHKLDAHSINVARRAHGMAPANFLTTKWASSKRRITQFSDRFPLRGASVSSGALFRGMCAEVGLTFRNVDYLKDPGEDLARRVDTAMELLAGDFDFVHVHTKLVDHAAHTKDPALKRRTIEACDTGLARLAGGNDDDRLIIVTADHATPSSGDALLIHSGEPVPLAVVGRHVPVDDVTRFSERACRHGLLGWMRAHDVMPQVINWTDRAGYYGARMSPFTQMARPSAVNPFRTEP